MQYIKDHKSEDLWDPWHFLGDKRRRLLDTSWPGIFRNFLLEKLPVEELSLHFHKSMGRPSKETYCMLGSLILQQMLDMTDGEVVEALAFNMQWHYALDIRAESDAEKLVTDRTLRSYRKLVMEENLAQLLFGDLTGELIEAFNVDVKKQRLDSTHIESNMRGLKRLELFARAIKVFLRNLKRSHPVCFEKVCERDIQERYLKKNHGWCFGHVKPSESRKKLEEVAQDLFWLVEEFKGQEPVTRMNSYKMLCRVLTEQCEVVREDQQKPLVNVKEPKDVPSDSLHNPSDEEAAYDKHKGVGYQVQIQETYSDEEGDETPDLITYVEVEPANRSDANAVEPMLEELERQGNQPEQLLADSAYGGDTNVQMAKEAGVELTSPSNPGSGKDSKNLGFGDFEYDEANQEISRCPAGCSPERVRRSPQGAMTAYFDRAVCLSCEKRSRCPVHIQASVATVRIGTAKKVRLAIRRSKDKTSEFLDKYRWRAGVEATMSRYKSQTGAGRLRVRGLAAVRFAAILKVLGLNILRCAKALKVRQSGRKPSHKAFFAPFAAIFASGSGILVHIAPDPDIKAPVMLYAARFPLERSQATGGLIS